MSAELRAALERLETIEEMGTWDESAFQVLTWVRLDRVLELLGGVDRIMAALTDEDELAHAEAWGGKPHRALGRCAYCDQDWPCRTQRVIARLAALTDRPAEKGAEAT